MSVQWDAELQTIDEALGWHEGVVESVLSHRAAALASYHRGQALSARFVGMSYDEIDAHFLKERYEVDAYAVVSIVAAAEAAIRADYHDRVRRNYKDALTRFYILFHQSLSTLAKVRPRFDENGILDALKAAGVMNAHLVTGFRNALRLRHWFAHGCYWTFTASSTTRSPVDVYAASLALISALPN